MNLENELKDEKNCSSKKTISIDDLTKQIHNLEIIIKGIEDHKILYTEEISKLKDDKSVAEQKLNEFKSIIKTQKNELAIALSKLAYAEEGLKNKNDSQIQKIQQLEHDTKTFEKEAQFYKVQHDFLTNKCLLIDKDLSESREIIKSLEMKINAIMVERNMIFDDLSKECNYLKRENSTFLENINELNESIICVNKKKNYLRDDLATCNEKLSIANDEISNFYVETKYLNTKLEKVTDKLTCIERELEETKLKLNQETYLKEKINEKYCRIIYECTCSQEKCQTADNHSDIMPCYVKEDEQTIHLKLIDVGSQTQTCPSLCQPITASINRDSSINNIRKCDNLNSSCDADKINNNPCQLDFKKTSIYVNSPDDYSCSVQSKNPKKCFGFFCDKENLQCQLNEMKQLLKKKEQTARKELCDTKQTYNNKEIIMSKWLEDTKEQCQKKLDEANAQLEMYETAILYKEYELKNFQIREHQYKMELEQLNETIKIKDKQIESEQILFAGNSMNNNEDQLSSFQKTELEKFNEHLQLPSDNYNVQLGKDSETDNKLEKPQTFIKKQRYSTKQNVKNNLYALKMSKTATKTKSKKYGPKLMNLPCCIGSKNPCNRQKSLNLLRMNQLKSEFGVSRNNLKTSEILRGPAE